MNRIIGRSGARALVATLCMLIGLAGTAAAPTAAGAEPSGGCRAVGGGSIDTAGTHRATVVVDTGTGTVWSACITFDGTISGLEALELAAATIPGLSPVYEPYPGQGRAVCRLIGVGNDPPNCLSKTVEYWSYFRNGEYARGGGSASVVEDGDVDGWSFSRGKAPRPATAGTEAVPRSELPAPATTAPPASTPATNPAQPGSPDAPAPPVDGAPDAGLGGSVPDQSAPSDDAAPGGDDDQPGSADGSAGTDSDADGGSGTDPADADADAADGEAAGGDAAGDGTSGGSRSGAGLPADETAVTVTEAGGSGGGGSSLGSVVGFGAAVGLAAVAALVVRRRRHLVVGAHQPDPTVPA